MFGCPKRPFKIFNLMLFKPCQREIRTIRFYSVAPTYKVIITCARCGSLTEKEVSPHYLVRRGYSIDKILNIETAHEVPAKDLLEVDGTFEEEILK